MSKFLDGIKFGLGFYIALRLLGLIGTGLWACL